MAANNNTNDNYSPKWYREGKWHDSQRGFIHFHPIYYLKCDRALGNSILRNSSIERRTQDQHSFIARTNTDWNSLPNGVIEKQSVKKDVNMYRSRLLPSSTTFKNADPGTCYHYFFLLSIEQSHFDYINIFTCTSAVIGYPLCRYMSKYQNIKYKKYNRKVSNNKIK